MRKYWAVFNVSWQNGFVYRLNFILWRVRSVIVILTVYFLWEAIFRDNQVVFGFERSQILTYVFLALILRSLVLGVRSIDVGGEISDGRLTNFLIKPINYHAYWFTRDLADKVLNIFFSVGEVAVLYYLLRPPVYIQGDLSILFLFIVAVVLAVLLNFILGSIASYTTFWTPGNTWGFWFVYLVIQELLGGVLFPLDILPEAFYQLVMLLPFPYLLFFPAKVYLGQLDTSAVVWGLAVCLAWVFVLRIVLDREWARGLRIYFAEGR